MTCPRCGGTQGFTYHAWFKEHHLGAWGSPAEASGSADGYRYPKWARCVECNYKVLREEAEADGS